MRKLVFIYFLLFSSCSFLGLEASKEDTIEEEQQLENQPEVERINYEQTEEKRPPLKIKIVKSYLDEKDRLNVKVLLEPETKISPKEVELSLQGLRDGEVVERQVKQLSELTPFETLRKDQSLAVLLQLASSDFSEYQVRLSWGEDAKEVPVKEKLTKNENENKNEESIASAESARAMLKPETKEPKEVKKVIGKSFPISITSRVSSKSLKCEKSPCDLVYTLTTNLKNEAEQPVSNIKLALSILWQAKGKALKLPAEFSPQSKNEQLIDLKSLVLAPGADKQLKIGVDRPVPISEKGKFVPHLRILSAEEVK